jgi:hypothetical protein
LSESAPDRGQDVQSGILRLQGLTTLGADVVVAITAYPGHVHIDSGLWRKFAAENPLTSKTASAWAVLSGGTLHDVGSLTAPDSVAIARAFARRRGPLSLPLLKQISPKTLTALIEKKDVEIPPVETLTLIPEPDGSVTRRIVVPSGSTCGRADSKASGYH